MHCLLGKQCKKNMCVCIHKFPVIWTFILHSVTPKDTKIAQDILVDFQMAQVIWTQSCDTVISMK